MTPCGRLALNGPPFKLHNMIIVGGGSTKIGMVQVQDLQGVKRIAVAGLVNNRKMFYTDHRAARVVDVCEAHKLIG